MADNTDSSDLAARARKWLDMAQAKWRLQTMQHRVRHNARTGEDTKLPTRIRRFLNGTPVGMKDAVLEILAETSPYESPVYDCEETAGLRYRPTNTFIRKDGPEHTTGGKDPTYTIIQDLLLDDGQNDAFGVRSESSCSRLAETEYVWDAAEIADADVGGQGVSYEVVNVSRDRETDLFSYQLRRVVALTQHSPAQVVECDSRHTVTEESWDNLYGEPGSFRKDGEASHGAGAAVTVPEPCSSPDGTTVAVDTRQNADCTYRVVVRTSVAHADGRGRGSSETVFEKSAWEAAVNQSSALAPAPAASNGVVVKRESEKNPDGTWNNREDTTTETLSQGARVTKRKTLRGVTTSTTDRNTADGTATVTNVGDQVEVVRTPGGLYDRTVTTVDKTPVGETGSGCETTVFEHRHQTLSNVATKPGAEAASAGGGKTHRKDIRQTEEGTFDVTETTTTEQKSTNARVVKRKTLRGVTTSTTDRNTTNNAATVSNVGDQVEVVRTPGGLYDRTVTTVSKTPVGETGSGCETTVFEHRHQTLSNVATKPEAEAKSAGGGKTYRKDLRLTEEGTFDVTETTTTEQKSEGARVVKRKTLRGVTVSTTDRNTADGTATVTNVGDQVEVVRTPGGLYDRTVTTVSKTPVGETGSGCETTVFEHRHQTLSNVAAKPEAEAASAGGGKTHRKDIRQTEEGTFDVTETTTTEQKSEGARVVKRKTLRGVTVSTTDRNTADGTATVTNVGDQVEVVRTPGGLYDRTVTTVAKTPVGETGSGCETTIFEHRHQTLSNVAAKPEAEAASAGGGKTYRKDIRQTEEGTFDVAETTTTEKPVVEAEVTKTRTLHGLRTRTLNRNQPSSAPDPQKIGDSVTNRKTNGGLTDVVKETFTVQPAGKTLDAEEENRHSKTVESVRNQQDMEAPTVTYTDGKVERKSSRLLEDGTADVGTRTVTAKPSQKTESWYDRYGTYTRCVYRNQQAPLLPSTTAANTRTSASFQMNDFGLFDGYWTKSGPPPAGTGGGDEQSNFTKTMARTEERIVAATRDGTSRREWYQERKWKRIMRYNTGNGWALDAMNDIAQYPGGSGLYMSRITGRCMWEYFILEEDWSETKERTIG